MGSSVFQSKVVKKLILRILNEKVKWMRIVLFIIERFNDLYAFWQNGCHGNMIQAIFKILTPELVLVSKDQSLIINLEKFINKREVMWLRLPGPK